LDDASDVDSTSDADAGANDATSDDATGDDVTDAPDDSG
jgi:hypothetical protein